MYRILRVADQIIWGCEYRACIRDCSCLPARLPTYPVCLPYLDHLPTHTHPDRLPYLYLPSWTSPKF